MEGHLLDALQRRQHFLHGYADKVKEGREKAKKADSWIGCGGLRGEFFRGLDDQRLNYYNSATLVYGERRYTYLDVLYFLYLMGMERGENHKMFADLK